MGKKEKGLETHTSQNEGSTEEDLSCPVYSGTFYKIKGKRRDPRAIRIIPGRKKVFISSQGRTKTWEGSSPSRQHPPKLQGAKPISCRNDHK